MKRILIYYKYVDVANPEAEKIAHQELCKKLNLEGRVLLATEGINGTVCGKLEATQAYVDAMNAHSLFNDMDFKWSDVDASYSYFARMQITVKPTILNTGIDPAVIKGKESGRHLSPEEVHQLLAEQNDDLVIIDTRNDFEWMVGAFKGAVKPKIEHFRDFPKYLDEHLDDYKDKKVLMYCTAGVRCESVSTYLKTKNVAKEVYQIRGGIQRYVEKYPDGYFRGKNYVFDNRITVKVNDDVLGSCYHCNKSCDDFTACLYATCNRHFIACEECLVAYENTCSSMCQAIIKQNPLKQRPPLVKVVVK